MANSYLSHTQSAGTSTRKFTYSVWMKRSSISTSGSYNSGFFNCWGDANNRLGLYFYENKLFLYGVTGGSANISVRTNRLFRDTSAWYHIVLAVDTTQGTAADRIKIYVNGVQETSLDQTTYPAQNFDFPTVGVNAKAIEIGRVNFGDQSSYYYMDGYLSHAAFVDGQQLAPTVFGSTDSSSGIWKFKSPSGVTWGTNGFHLKMENSGALGTDSSGNTNTFTVNGNLKQALDTPSNVYATVNALQAWYPTSTTPVLSNGNNTIRTGKGSSSSAGYFYYTSTLGMPSSGKWYFEVKPTETTANCLIGIVGKQPTSNAKLQEQADGYMYSKNGNKRNNNVQSSYGDTYDTNDIIGVAVDLDNNKIYFSKNGTYQNSGVPTSGSTGTGAAYTIGISTTGDYFAVVGDTDYAEQSTFQFNFGNGYFGTTAITSAGSNGNGSLFEFDCPSGYYALNTKNINTYG